MSVKPGMVTVLRYLGDSDGPSSQGEVCYRIARELRGEINALWAQEHGSVSNRPGKKERAHKLARIEGMKWALALALGIPLGAYQDKINIFLEEFKAERLDAAGKR